ncbi:MAG: hypothetical protein LCH81_14510 [Bacteroidetes bacterium]|nr:hypothetical protein [Bacteroidota bacterium]
MILYVIGILTLAQLAIYTLLDDYKVGLPKSVILMLLLVCYFFILPPLFYPKHVPGKIRCGNPAMGITMAFWVFGGAAALGAHTLYQAINPKSK